MTPDSLWRLDLARKIAPAYAAQSRVAATVVGGSVAHGWADRWSDVELGIFWNTPPTEAEAAAAAGRANAVGRRVYASDGRGAWEEEYEVAGVKVDVAHWCVADVDRVLREVVGNYDPDWAKQVLVGTLHAGIPLHGADVIEGWRARGAYPLGLARAMVERHLVFGPHAWLEMLAERDDFLVLHELCARAERQILGTLFGLNHVYPSSPDAKWLRQRAQELRLAPLDLAPRLGRVFRAPPVDGVRELGDLIAETIALVEEHLPGVDTTAVRQRVAQRRPTWAEPPRA